MRKTVLAALPLTLLALAVPATAAQARGKATSYRATIAPLAAAPSGDGASASKRRRHESASRRAPGVRGQARLTDGARRDRLRIKVRGLDRGAKYTWSLRVATGGADACAGEVVDAFSYGTLRRGHDSDRSRDFAVEPGAAYAVVVTDAEGTDVACGEFGGKAAGGEKRGKGRDKASDDESGDDSAEDESDDDSADHDESGDDLIEGHSPTSDDTYDESDGDADDSDEDF
jgi:hypothetical protein